MSETLTHSSPQRHWWPRAVAIAVGIGFIVPGVWAMVDPHSFFTALAAFEPYNQHFLQDIGAFQIGLGVVLLLAGMRVRADGLSVALVGVGVGAAFHAVSHIIGRGLGGTPQTDIPLFTHNFFDAPFWEKPEQWLKQSSLMYVGNVTTPTVVMTGELDLRTPMAQSEEYYAALKMRRVETVLLRFQGEYHGTASKPSNFMRTQLYMMSWYGKHKRDATAAASSN